MKKDEKPYMKGRGRGDIHESNLNYLETVVDQFLWLAKNRNHWVLIECMQDGESLRSRENIHEQIMSVLTEKGIIKVK